MATRKKAAKKKPAKKKPRNPNSNNFPYKPAPLGNRFWEMRSKHGRDKLFKTPELLWEAATEYFKWCEDNPLMEVDYRGKEIIQVEIPKMRCFTIQGLTLYLGCNVQYFNDLENSLKGKDDEISRNFSSVITDIRQIIYTNKFTGAAAGFLHANIIARDLGLTDKKDITTGGEKITQQADLSKLNEDELRTLVEIQSKSRVS